MKLTVNIGRDEELRKEIIKLVQREVKNITDEEIRRMAQDHLNNVNVAAKVTSTIKDLLNKQIDFLVRGYGDSVIKQQMEEKMNEWIEKSFEKWFNTNAKGFIQSYLEDKVKTLKEFFELLDRNKK